MALLALCGGLLADSDPADACAAEIQAMPGVWISPDRALPIYCDLRLVAYLASLGRRLNAGRSPQPPVAVLPVYSAEALCFARNGSVFVSTGLLLHAEDEQDLERTLAAQLGHTRRKRSSSTRVSPCALIASPADCDFPSLREQLARQIQRYEESVRPQLRIRTAETGGQPTSSPVLRPASGLP